MSSFDPIDESGTLSWIFGLSGPFLNSLPKSHLQEKYSSRDRYGSFNRFGGLVSLNYGDISFQMVRYDDESIFSSGVSGGLDFLDFGDKRMDIVI